MERKLFITTSVFFLTMTTLSLFTYADTLSSQTLHRFPHRAPNFYIIEPDASDISIPENFRGNKPQPLMRGEGFNYNLYYNYRLTPHLILRPNVQQTTKPGAVSDDSHPFVGGISAGVNF